VRVVRSGREEVVNASPFPEPVAFVDLKVQ
jgi:hypothetical protein